VSRKPWLVILNNLEKFLVVITLAVKGVFSSCHKIQCDAARPNVIETASVLSANACFWRKKYCRARVVSDFITLVQRLESTNAEISELYVVIFVDQNVLRLDISVYNFYYIVAVVKSLNQLAKVLAHGRVVRVGLELLRVVVNSFY